MSWNTTRLSKLVLASAMVLSVVSNAAPVYAEESETEVPVEEVVEEVVTEETPSEIVEEEVSEDVVAEEVTEEVVEEETAIEEETPVEVEEVVEEATPETEEEEVPAEEETVEVAEEADADAVKSFLEDLNDDGYAEVGKFKVEKIKTNVYHWDEETKAVPGGATTDAGMNNPTSKYFYIAEDGVVLFDLGNPEEVGSQSEADAKTIIDAMVGTKPVTIVLTHGHGDHTGLGQNPAVFADVNVEKLYIGKADLDMAKDAIKPFIDADIVETVEDGDSITIYGTKYDITVVSAHTNGSLMIADTEHEVLYIGDTFGSGFIWALWPDFNDGNPLAALSDGCTKARNIINGMPKASILAGHRWQQFWANNAQRPNEMSIQYFNDMAQVINGLMDGTTVSAPYSSVAWAPDAIELSSNGAKAKIDTLPEIVEAYKKAVNAMSEAYVYSASDKLSIESVNATAAPVFVIYPDGYMSDDDAEAFLKDTGLQEVVDHSASKAFIARPANGSEFTAADVEGFKKIVGKIAVTSNFKLIGIGNGATFVNQNLTGYTNFMSGLALINPEEGAAVKSSVPTYLVTDKKAVVDAYVKANSAKEVKDGFYQNPDSRFEIVEVNDNTKIDAVSAVKEAWEDVLDLYGRIGNYSEVYKETATWYSRPLLTGNDEYDQSRKYQFYDSIEAIENTKRVVMTEDLNGSGTKSLWYEYIPSSASTEAGTVPMVVLMHGNTNDPRTQYDSSGWAQVAEKYGVILVCPEWQGHTYQGYTYEPMTADSNATPGSDMIKMLKGVLAKYPQIDASRVYISGLSAGSRNTTNACLSNPDFFAAGAGQSGPFGIDATNMAQVESFKDKYDMPIMFFTGDGDEYCKGAFDNNGLDGNGGLQVARAYQEMNEMTVTDPANLDADDLFLYGVKWDKVEKHKADAEVIADFDIGYLESAKGVEIAMARIYGWGHWNFAPDAEYMWAFMSKYARDLETGKSIRLDKTPEAEPGVTVNGHDVTFCFEDTSDKNAVKVTVAGNFQWALKSESDQYVAMAENEGMMQFRAEDFTNYDDMYNQNALHGLEEYEMSETSDEHFEITLTVPGNLYYYDYNVYYEDGTMVTVKDPANLSEFNPADGKDAGHSLVYVGSATDTEPGQEYIYARTDGKVGTREYVPYTDINGATAYLEVYLPYGYDASKTYPTVYVSHGGGGNEAEWMTIGAAANIFDNLIAEGELEPTVMVTMDNNVLNWGDVSQKNTIEKIIPFIESKYSVSTDPEDRAFCGLSMGSMMTNGMAMNYPEYFGYLGSFSGGSQDLDASKYNVTELNNTVLYLTAGCVDMAYNNTKGISSLDYLAMYDKLGVNYTFDLLYGAHDWKVWRESLTNFAKDYLWEKKGAADLGVTVDGHDVTFGFQDTNPEKRVEKVTVAGNFQWALKSESDQYVAMADNEGMKQFRAEDFTNYDEMYNENGLHGLEEYEMTKVYGERYELTITVPGNLYYYDYNVYYTDGTMETVKDPYNLSEYNPADGKDAGHSLVYVGSPTDTEAGQEYIYARTDGKVGTREYIPYKDINGKTAYLEVYLPYGYDESKTYPTVYVSHGGGGNEAEWMTIGAAANIFDNLIADGELAPTVMVTMDNNVLNWGDVSQKNTIEKIIPYIEKNYSVSKDPADRAFCGLSMGSMMTNGMAMNYPEYFGYLGSFSGGSQDLDASKYNVEELNKTVLYLTAGCVDMAYNNTMGISSLDYLAMYDKLGVNYTFDLLYGAHDWKVWRESLTNFAKDYLWERSAEVTNLHIVGDDWGPSVDKVTVTLSSAITAAELADAEVAIKEIKEATNWAGNPYEATIATADRKVLKAYFSDEKGNEVSAAEGTIVTFELYVSPNDGSPFRYVLQSGFNKWCDPYEVTVDMNINGETFTADNKIDLTDDKNWVSEPAQKFDVTKTYKATDGTVYQYGEYLPAEDGKKNALVVWLHGAGEGQNVNKIDGFENDVYIDLLGNEVTALVSDEFQSLFDGAYVLVPQSPTMWMDDGTGAYQSIGESCYGDSLFEMIDAYVKANPDIDPTRVIVGGCSNGGYMTVELILDHPGYFQKAYPICEAFTDSAISDAKIKALAESRTGVWFTFADNDTTVVPTATSIPTIARLKKAGADVHYTEWPDVRDLTGRFEDADGNPYQYAGHWSWIYFDNNANTTCNVHGTENEWVWLATPNIDNVKVSVKDTVYNGKVQKPASITVTADGKAITDYTVVSMPSAKDAGSYNVVVKVGGHTYTAKWIIHKADQKLCLTSPKKNYFSYTKTYKYKTLKKKSKSFKLAFTGNQATVRKISGSAALRYNSKTQKVTVKKGTKKGTYKLRLNAPETKNYGGSNAITIIVKVK